MQEFFFTILAIWVLFRIFGGQSSVRYTSYHAHQHHHHNPQPKEGEVKIESDNRNTSNTKPGDSSTIGEYVDYEEIH